MNLVKSAENPAAGIYENPECEGSGDVGPRYVFTKETLDGTAPDEIEVGDPGDDNFLLRNERA